METTYMKKALISGVTGQDGSYLGRVSFRQRLRGARNKTACFFVKHTEGRSPV